MKKALILILGLAACGADGAPEKPTRTSQPGIGVSGTVGVGVVGG